MTHHPFIRPTSIHYHDYLQKKVTEDNSQVPIKFMQREQDDYVPKPARYIKNLPKPVAVIQKHKYPVFSNFCNLCECCEPKLCDKCGELICAKCRQTCFPSLRMCEECKKKLCPYCKQSLVKCCEPKEGAKLRNYPIMLKKFNELHFEDCQCDRCLRNAQGKHRNEESRVRSRMGSQFRESQHREGNQFDQRGARDSQQFQSNIRGNQRGARDSQGYQSNIRGKVSVDSQVYPSNIKKEKVELDSEVYPSKYQERNSRQNQQSGFHGRGSIKKIDSYERDSYEGGRNPFLESN